MASQNLVDVFNVKKRTIITPDVVDYDIFPDKDKFLGIVLSIKF